MADTILGSGGIGNSESTQNTTNNAWDYKVGGGAASSGGISLAFGQGATPSIDLTSSEALGALATTAKNALDASTAQGSSWAALGSQALDIAKNTLTPDSARALDLLKWAALAALVVTGIWLWRRR